MPIFNVGREFAFKMLKRIGVIDRGVAEIWLFQSNDIKNMSFLLSQASSSIQIYKSTVYEGCLICSRPRVETSHKFVSTVSKHV